MSTRHERNRPRAKGYPLSIWDSDAETNSTLDSDTYLPGSLLTRSATLGTKTNGIKCVSIEEPPRAQEKNQHFSAAENRNRRREKETMPSLHQTGPQPPGSRVLAASSQLSTLNSQLSILISNAETVSTLDSHGYASTGPVDSGTKRAIKPMESN
jgi:hypothetical protein